MFLRVAQKLPKNDAGGFAQNCPKESCAISVAGRCAVVTELSVLFLVGLVAVEAIVGGRFPGARLHAGQSLGA